MVQVTLGRTGIVTNKNAFGALPIQRVSAEYAGMLLRKAYEGGITFFDTARSYSDSEEKMGLALHDVRDKIFIATKTPSTTVEGFWKDLETSLRLLRTDYVDIYQFHNPAFCPKPGDGTGLYEAMLEAKEQGKIRFIGITNHRLGVAEEAVASGLYDTLQFPFCYLATDRDIALVEPVQGEGRGVHLHEGAVRGASHQLPPRPTPGRPSSRTPCPSGACSGRRSCDEFLSYIQSPPVTWTDGAAGPHREGPEGAQRQLLPGLRLLHALPGWTSTINQCARMSQLHPPQPLGSPAHPGELRP